ncbi:MAG: hypothetical protein ACRDTE_06605 [Pseudonocardiaceae bacterium]
MNQHSSDESVHVTGEERLHPALRKLGRACIALARWQRAQQATSGKPSSNAPASDPPAASQAPRVSGNNQEARDASA